MFDFDSFLFEIDNLMKVVGNYIDQDLTEAAASGCSL
jgi:hypothetical protein